MKIEHALWQKRNKKQLRAASVGLFFGFLLLLFAAQTFLDVQKLMQGAGDQDLLVLNRRVGLGTRGPFTAADVDTFAQQSFFQDVGSFNSNRFRATAHSEQLGFQTELFFQSIPNRFLDVDTSKFVYKSGKDVPILLSSDYLALYNFGFAPSQGLPQFTAESIGFVKFQLVLQGKGKRIETTARIAGFTRNVNSILVPNEWLQEMNAQLGDADAKPANQLIVRTDNPYHKDLEHFLKMQDCEISRGGLIGGGLKAVLYLLIGLMLLIGGIILGLSLLVFLLNYQLLITQSAEEIRLLLQLGYKHLSLSQVLWKELRRSLLFSFGLGILSLFPPKFLLSQALQTQGYEQIDLWVNPMVLALALVLALLFAWFNLRALRRQVQALAY